MEIKPCPFCGSDLIQVEDSKSLGHDDNDCILSGYLFFPCEMKAWNRRTA